MNATHFANPLLQASARPQPRRIAVIGAGAIGPDIAYYLKTALPQLTLTLIDIRQPAIDAALARLREYTEKAVARGKLAATAAAAVMADLHGSTDYDALADCDWVLEAATEDLALKHRIFADVEARVADDAIITSNTSSLPAARVFAALRRPERATVTHFFAPAWRNPAVEVIDWPRADPALVELAAALLLHDRQAPAGDRRRAVLHARPRVRQLVQRGGAAARWCDRRRDRQRRCRVRPRRARSSC